MRKEESPTDGDQWTCILCGLPIKAGKKGRVWLRTTISNHLHQRHAETIKQHMRENLKWRKLAKEGKKQVNRQGRESKTTRNGLGLTELVRPVVPSQIPESIRAWSCPYCPLGLPELKKYQKEMSV